MNEPLLELRNLSHVYTDSPRARVPALSNVSFRMERGEILGLVGESGSGKSTLARCVMGTCHPCAGELRFNGIDLRDRRALRRNRRLLAARRQIIFQDSASSLNPRMRVEQIVTEPMAIHGVRPPRGSLRAEAEFQLHYVGLDKSYLDRYPPELSGGQRQRVAIARALTMEPELLVADEPITALDGSIQAQIVNLFHHLRQEHGCSILFIAHDLAMTQYLCDRIGVMYQGRLVELAEGSELFDAPCHPYTHALLSSVARPDPRAARAREDWQTGTPLSPDASWQEVRPGHFVLKENGA